MDDIHLIARSILPGTESPYYHKSHLLREGNVLLLLADLWIPAMRRMSGPPDHTSIDAWSIHDPQNPRLLLRMKTLPGWVVETTVFKGTKDKEVGRLVIVNASGDYDSVAGQESALRTYDLYLDEDKPAIIGVQPPYDRIVSESWQPIPHFPEWRLEGQGSVEVSHVAGDVVACTVQLYDERPLGDYDESAGAYNEQLNPRFPLPGFEQIYLAHLSGPTYRWLHPRYVEAFIGARAYPHDGHLYLLGRTASTYVVHDYHFHPDVLLSPTSDPDADFLELGSPLAGYETGRLPDPRVPWGSWDHEDVHFDPLHGFTILLLHDWFGKGQVVHLPIPRSGEPTPRWTMHAFTSPTLPSNTQFKTRWLGVDHAIIYGEEEFGPDSGGDFFFRLSFAFNERVTTSVLDSRACDEHTEATVPSAITRHDLRMSDVRLPDYLNPEPFLFDGRSGRICITKQGAQDQTELYVFSLPVSIQ